MPTLEELSAQVDQVQAALDAEQQQVADLLAQKDATIAALQTTVAQLEAEGGTPEGRQAVADKLNTLLSDLTATVTTPPNEEPPADPGTT